MEINKKLDKDIYSTSEIFTGKYWIDNKPIYRKVINFGSLPNNTVKGVSHNISNLDKCIDIRGYCSDGTNFFGIPQLNRSSDTSLNTQFLVNSTQVRAANNGSRESYSAYVILEYTKKS